MGKEHGEGEKRGGEGNCYTKKKNSIMENSESNFKRKKNSGHLILCLQELFGPCDACKANMILTHWEILLGKLYCIHWFWRAG